MRAVPISLVLAAALAAEAAAFELRTHAELTRAAVARSSLDDALASLGIAPGEPIAPSSVVATPLADFRNDGTALGWMQSGAILEDGAGRCDPRPRHHFYEPASGEGYRAGLVSGQPSRRWGLEPDGSLGGQDYSYEDAKRALWESLLAPDGDSRGRLLAHALESFGRVLHLVQDLAQPQHTRNDSHAGKTCSKIELFGPASVFELSTEDLARRGALDFGAYPVVTLPRARDYWDTDDGRGLAEFSNAGFVTAGTNFRGTVEAPESHPRFPSPDARAAAQELVPASELVPAAQSDAPVRIYGTWMQDRYTGESFWNRVTSSSALDPELARRGGRRAFTLNRANYDAARALLLPRAVGYGAGLVDFFFRGRLEVEAPERGAYAVAAWTGSGTSFVRLDARVRAAAGSEQVGPGVLHAVVRYRRPLAGADLFATPDAPLGEPSWAVSAPIDVAPGADFVPVSFDFSAAPIPANAADVFLTVAFRGPLIAPDGTADEGAVLLGGKDLYEPDRYDLANLQDYDCFAGTLHDATTIAAGDRDVDGDGAIDVWGPVEFVGTYVETHAASESPQPGAAAFDYRAERVGAAQLLRFAFLQDRPIYRVTRWFDSLWSPPEGRPSGVFWIAGLYPDDRSYAGVLNRFVELDGVLLRQIAGYGAATVRGTPGFKGRYFVLPNVRRYGCDEAVRDASRAMTEVAGTAR